MFAGATKTNPPFELVARTPSAADPQLPPCLYKIHSVCYEMGSFGVEQPGYYGVQGYEVIYLTLASMFMSPAALNETARLAHPLSPDYFIRKVLVPETALRLIAEDLNTVLTDPLVYKTLEDSRAYGLAKFPDTASLI
ncbi:uncharacterized protein VP01_5064g1 [Puccinia sorghi]|uniref:Restriction of telomere capping protein 4 n=1 Tax=Puccinia sorghi TaxID=27349 RepID=A0A0L6ULG9_9BASI|nr:uncharacterized protein VP01_5064g1 [Puccinia sorghi]